MQLCEICGEPMPAGEEMFKFHGYSGPCPKPPKLKNYMQFYYESLNVLAQHAAFTRESKGFDAPSAANLDRKLLLAVSELCEAQDELRDGHDITEIYAHVSTTRELSYDQTVGIDVLRGDPELKPEGVPIELADALIRILDIARSCNINLAEAVALKMAHNVTRPAKHGRQF
jgi:NTP pyrophosphatase (non-canonical NTP hydrolase)